MRAPRGLLAAVLLAAFAYARAALAQTSPSIDARTWRPSTDAEASLVSEPTVTPGPWRWNVGAWTAYALDPVRYGSAPSPSVSPVRNSVTTDVVAAVGLGDRAAVGFDVPLLLWQGGDSGLTNAVVSGGKVSATGVGDVLVTGKADVLSNDRQGVKAGLGLAATGYLSLPTADRQSFLGEGAVTSSVSFVSEYALGVVALRASIGYFARTGERRWPGDPIGGVRFGDSIPWALGIVLRPKVAARWLDSDDRQIWEVAAHGGLPAGPVGPFGVAGSGASLLSPALLALDDRIAIGHRRDVFLLVGFEAGLDSAVGVPPVRGVISFGWAPRIEDKDNDTIPDDRDECPDLAEDFDGIQDSDGCPEDDADGDGILDSTDACPLVPGVTSSEPKKNGCPTDAVHP